MAPAELIIINGDIFIVVIITGYCWVLMVPLVKAKAVLADCKVNENHINICLI